MIFTKELTYLPIVQSAADKYSVPVALVMGHIKQESNFSPDAYRAEPAISDASYGLMQLLTKTAKTLDPSATAEKLLDPSYNVDLGTKYIAQNLARYGGDVKSAIAAYNSGTALKDANGNYVNTKGVTNVQGYVDKVYSNYQYYTQWLENGAKAIDITLINPWYVFGFIASAGLFFGAYYYSQQPRRIS